MDERCLNVMKMWVQASLTIIEHPLINMLHMYYMHIHIRHQRKDHPLLNRSYTSYTKPGFHMGIWDMMGNVQFKNLEIPIKDIIQRGIHRGRSWETHGQTGSTIRQGAPS